MALLWADNFGWLTTAQLARLYTVSGTVVTGAFGVFGGSAARITGTTGELLAIPAFPAPSGATCILSFDFRIGAAPASAQALCNVRLGSTVHITVALNNSRQIAVYRNGTGGTLLGTSTYVVPLNTRVHFSIRAVIDNAGSVVVRITEGGTTTITNNLASVDTQEGGTATWDRFTVNGCNASTTDVENLIAQDGTGAVNNDILGPDVEVKTLLPNGAGAHGEWLRVGSVFRDQNVDDPTANDDTDYNYSETVDQLDTHEMGDLTNAALAVYGVMLVHVARRSGTGTVAISPVAREGSTDVVGAAFPNLGASYLAYQKSYNTLPSGTAWDVDQLNFVQLGYKRTT